MVEKSSEKSNCKFIRWTLERVRAFRVFWRDQCFGAKVKYLIEYRDDEVPEGRLPYSLIARILEASNSSIHQAVEVILIILAV